MPGLAGLGPSSAKAGPLTKPGWPSNSGPTAFNPLRFASENSGQKAIPSKHPHLTLTLSPPIRMGAEREQQAGSVRNRKVVWQGQVQGFNARILRGILSPPNGERVRAYRAVSANCLAQFSICLNHVSACDAFESAWLFPFWKQLPPTAKLTRHSSRIWNRQVNGIAGRLSLRKPQRDSLEMLGYNEIIPREK